MLTRKQKNVYCFYRNKKENNMSILDTFASIYEKQDILSKLTSKRFLYEYGYSKIHCIDCINELEDANVTGIAKRMHMTRGAISKMTKELIQKELISTYTKENNKKEIYFSLTVQGQQLCQEHQKRHQLWLQRDQAFLNTYSSKELEVVTVFLESFEQ